MLPYDPIPWLMAQEGLPAVRARRMLGLHRDGDEKAVAALERKLVKAQLPDGSFEQSPMKTAGVLNLLDDLRAAGSEKLIASGVSYLMSVLESQPGYEQARSVGPGSVRMPCDLCGFFGPYQDRNQPEALARDAREMNFYREYEPLLGPKSPSGSGSCYAWGLIPLSYTIETLCRAGHARDPRLQPAINALLGAQRENGGWCRGLGGSQNCTVHAVRALGSHPELRQSRYAERALETMRAAQTGPLGGKGRWWWRGSKLLAAIQAIATFDLPIARVIIRDALAALALHQRKNGTFGTPCKVERVAAALCAKSALESSAGADA